jgi:hypothetical protein
LEIISGYDQNIASVRIKVLGIKGPCLTHKNKVIDLGDIKLENDSDAIFKAASKRILFNGIPWSPSTKKYFVHVNTCSNKQYVADITVYPDISVDVKVNFGLELEEKEKLEKAHNGHFNSTTIEDKSWKLGISGTWKEDGIQHSVEYQLSEIIESIKKVTGLFRWASSIVGEVCSKGNLAVGSEFKFETCNLEFSARYSWKEVENSNRCDREYEFELGMNPLLKVSGAFDISGPMMLSVPGLGPILRAGKELLERTKKGELSLKLTIGGGFSGSIKMTKAAGVENVENLGSISGKIEIEFKGTCKIKDSYFSVSVSGEASLGSKCDMDLTLLGPKKDIEKRNFLDFRMACTGIKFYSVAIVQVGYKKESLDHPYKNDIESTITYGRKTESEGMWLKRDEESVYKFYF